MNAKERKKYLKLIEESKYTIEEVEEVERLWKKAWKPGWGFSMNGYAYYPNDSFTRWTASDGSVVRESNMGYFVLVYGDAYLFEEWGYNGFYSTFDQSSILVKKRMDQQDYEGAKLRGDVY